MKILAIDDNQNDLTLLKIMVARALPGAELLTATNGSEGLALALAEDPDVILLDIIMPGMDGFTTCRKLKEAESLQFVPVVFLSGFEADKKSRIRALESGAEGFLNKPTDEAELIAEIRAMAKIKAASQMQKLQKEQLAILVEERTRELQESHDRLERAVVERTQRLRRLATELTLTEQRERRRLADFLHDDLQQVHAAAMLAADKLVEGKAGSSMKREVMKLHQYLEEAISKTRRVGNELVPSLLYMLGMGAALRQLVTQMQERHDLQVQLDLQDELDQFSEDIKIQLFNFIQELLFNVAKHSGTKAATLSIKAGVKRIEIIVSDEGKGIERDGKRTGETQVGGYGLFRISEQLENLGGEMTITSAPGKGTRIAMTVPVTPW